MLKFKDKLGNFEINNVSNTSYLYFPITNGYSMKASITPSLNGDVKLDQNHFALVPVSQEDLQNSNFGRHFWFNIAGYGLFNASGVSARQKFENKDEVTVEAGFLYHTVTRTNREAGIQVSLTTFAPFEDANVELTKVTIKNVGNKTLEFVPTLAVPLYSRSADNLRDHRHVTALLNRATVVNQGIINKPTLSFDERGHLVNTVSYGVFVSDEVVSYNPKLQEFVGEGGSLDWPKSLHNDQIGNYQIGDQVDGFEVVGAMQLSKKTLSIQETYSTVFAIAIDEQGGQFETILTDYCNESKFNQLLEENKNKWQEKLSSFNIKTSDESFDNWVKWVSIQPILRRIYGCSFLPHHDYGRGGRGWRDLWQDCLALILMESGDVEFLLYNNFGGVRIDGSNATIIGSKPGQFVADRNNIPRVWMDHGVWPWNTTKLYVERSGNVDFLFKKQTYFKDANVFLAKRKDTSWNDSLGNKQLNKTGQIYEGTILEHILVQNLTQFYNVGEHNNIRLEGADWNDGLDMARVKGESVTFTSFYMMNLKQLASTLVTLKTKGISDIAVFDELLPLIYDNVNYDDYTAKKAYLEKYFESVSHNLSGNVTKVNVDELVESLNKKATYLLNHLRKNEWFQLSSQEGFFNGYYDNKGQKLEGNVNGSVRMTLTGQVFPIMSGVASDEQIDSILNAANKYLYDPSVSGYRLNNNFNEVKLDMGRLFGFAFGHKENGAMFSHMAMMFANALYQRNRVNVGYQVLHDIYKHCIDFSKAKIYPGIPEYLDSDGRGMYHYLTGSASWYILNVVNEMFGVKGQSGNLYLLPKLALSQFDEQQEAKITTEFGHKIMTITYVNKNRKDANQYKVSQVVVNNKEVPFTNLNNGAVIHKELFSSHVNEIKVILE